MLDHAYDEILNYLVDQIQRLAPDEQKWLIDNMTKLIRERVTDSKYSYTYEEVRHYVSCLKPEDQLQLFKYLAISVLPKAKIVQKHNVMEFEGAAKDFWKGIDVKQYIEEERNSWDKE